MGKGAAYRARKGGQIPGIVYGGSTTPVPVQVDERTLGRMYAPVRAAGARWKRNDGRRRPAAGRAQTDADGEEV